MPVLKQPADLLHVALLSGCVGKLHLPYSFVLSICPQREERDQLTVKSAYSNLSG